MKLYTKLKIVSGLILGLGFLLGIYMGDVYAKPKSGPYPNIHTNDYHYEWTPWGFVSVPNTTIPNRGGSRKKYPSTKAILITWGVAGALGTATLYISKSIEKKG